MSKPVRTVGFVGAGRIAGVHRRHLATVGITDVAVYDATRSRAEEFGGRIAGSLDELIAISDLVAICTPSSTHREIAIAALDQGKPVFIEKPIALTSEDAAALVAREDAGAFISVGQVVRFFPAYAAAHRAIAEGNIGKIAVARFFRGGGFPSDDGRAWYADHARSGGVIVDLAIHDLDWLLWTLGPATSVTARSVAGDRKEGRDHALATIEFASGAMAHIEASWMEPGPFRTGFDIAGTGGLLEYDSAKVGPVTLAPADDPYARQWQAILDAVASGKRPPVTARDGAAALDLALAARESARRREPVRLEGSGQKGR